MRHLIFCLLLAITSQAVNAQPPAPKEANDVDLVIQELDQNQLRVHFIDIGPGLAVLIQTPVNRRSIFIDGGKWELDDMETYVARFVPQNSTINLAIVTHADLDHYQGMNRIFGKYKVSEFWYTGYTSEELEKHGSKWSRLLDKVEDEEDCIIRNPVSEWKKVGDTVIVDDRGTGDKQDDIKIVLLNVDAEPPHKDFVSGREFDESQRRNMLPWSSN